MPVGGVSQSAVAGDAEVQLLLKDPGTLSMRIFNRQNDMQQQFDPDRQGYTQGIGLSYEVDFNTTGELFRKIFKKEQAQKANGLQQDTTQLQVPPEDVIQNDSLIRFRSKSPPQF